MPCQLESFGDEMLPAANAWAFTIAAFVMIVIPGPSVLFIIGRSVSLGRKGGLLTVIGNDLGELPAIALVSLGVGGIVAESVVAFTIIKLVGAAYLIYLGVQTIRRRHDHRDASVSSRAHPSPIRLLREGFLVGVSNPKSAIFFVAVLPQFVSYRAGDIPIQMALLGLIFFAIALAVDSMWALTAGTARVWLARHPKRLSQMEVGGGVVMIGLGGALALTGNKN